MRSTHRFFAVALLLCSGLAHRSAADDPRLTPDQPKPIPQTRSEIKLALERLKQRIPRFPLPEPTAEEIAAAGDRPIVNNGRARRLFLPAEWFAADFGNDPSMTLDYPYKTQCFWIVSRGNNCHYCLGHQEHKLLAAGLSDDQIGSLDTDWKSLDPRLAAGVALSRKMTLEPHLMTEKDIADLRGLLTDAEITELVYTIAMFNSVNRWTDAMGLPQDQLFRGEPIHFDTSTAAQFDTGVCLATPTTLERPAWEPWSSVQAQIQQARTRSAYVELPTIEQTRQAFQWDEQHAVAGWQRALARFPKVGAQQIASWQAIAGKSELSPRLKAMIAFVTARENRSWAALDLAVGRLDQYQVPVLDGELDENSWQATADELKALKFARKLTATPQLITDADVADLRASFSDRQAAEIIYVTGAANLFDRFTETLHLSTGGA
jgi:alkylhydroperoxidase family enzyme